MLMRICTPTYEFCLLLVVPFLLVLPKLNVHSLACDESSHISETGCLMSGCQDLHSCTYIMTLTLMLTKSVQSLLPNTRGGCSKGASFTSRIQVNGKRPRNYNVQPQLVGGGVGGVGGVGGCGGEVICLKRVQIVLSAPKFGPPQSKIPGSAPAL